MFPNKKVKKRTASKKIKRMFKNFSIKVNNEYKDTKLRLKPSIPKGKKSAWNLSIDHTNLNIRKYADRHSQGSDDEDSLIQSETQIEELPSHRIDKFTDRSNSVDETSNIFESKTQLNKSKMFTVRDYANNFENATRLDGKIEKLQGKLENEENNIQIGRKGFDRQNVPYDIRVQKKLRRPQTGKNMRLAPKQKSLTLKRKRINKAWIS